MSSNNNKGIKSYKGFEEGSYVSRKGRICIIKKIHFEMHPPSVTVKMMDTQTEVGTEFDRLKQIKSWFCDMCTAENNDNLSNKCSFCSMKRSFKEKITIKQEQEQEQELKSTENEKEKEMESPQLSESPESEQSDQIQHKESEKEKEESSSSEEEQEEEEEEESEYEDDEYEHVKDNDLGYYDDEYHDLHKNKENYYQNREMNRNRFNRNRMNRNRNRNPFNQQFGFDGWNTSPFFNRFFM